MKRALYLVQALIARMGIAPFDVADGSTEGEKVVREKAQVLCFTSASIG